MLGTTGSGKTTLLHNIIANLLINNNSHLFLLDPKRIEFNLYSTLNNTNVYSTIEECKSALSLLNSVMEERFSLLVNDSNNKLQPIVLIVDEFGDIFLQDKTKEFVNNLTKLAQKSRAAKIYMILATQRPSAKIIDGAIKANISARIACKTVSSMDSRIILDSSGAENLLGKGDAILKDSYRNLERFQIAYVSPEETYEYLRNK